MAELIKAGEPAIMFGTAPCMIIAHYALDRFKTNLFLTPKPSFLAQSRPLAPSNRPPFRWPIWPYLYGVSA
jgi:hypothetical protein